MGTFLITKYHCEIDDETADGVDYQGRYFDTVSPAEIFNRLQGEQPNEYENNRSETVRWIFEETKAIEINPALRDGEEIIGFITGTTIEKKNTEQKL